MFISIDGANGVGKTSISTLVYERLQQKYNKVFLTKEPTNSDIGQFIRNLENIEKYKGYPLFHLILADRHNHLNEIKQKLRDGYIVITDRYVASSLVYQVLDGIDIEEIFKHNSTFKIPNICFFISMNKETIKKNLNSRCYLTRFETESTLEKEIELFKSAKIVLENNGFNCIEIYNDILEDSVELILTDIHKYIQQNIGKNKAISAII